MRKIFSLSLIALAFIGAGCLSSPVAQNSSFAPSVNAMPRPSPVHVSNVSANDVVTSPLTVKGEAPGTWFFEASFPVRLLDADGNILVAVPASAGSDWMTTAYVPFEAKLTFTKSKTETGTLVFAKDNPSGLPEHDESFSIPVRFVAAK